MIYVKAGIFRDEEMLGEILAAEKPAGLCPGGNKGSVNRTKQWKNNLNKSVN